MGAVPGLGTGIRPVRAGRVLRLRLVAGEAEEKEKWNQRKEANSPEKSGGVD